jgi:hypothetical protein
LSFNFLLTDSSTFTSFLSETSSCIFGYSLPLEVSIRKLKLSSLIAVVLQASQTAVVFYNLSSSIVSCTSGFFRLQLSFTNYQTVKFNSSCILGFTDCSCLLPFSSSIVSFASGLIRPQLSSINFSSSIVSFASGLLRPQLSSINFSSSIVSFISGYLRLQMSSSDFQVQT